MEDLLAKTALTGITIFCFGIIVWLLKRWLKAEGEKTNLKIDILITKQTEINGDVKDVIQKHHKCREELPEKYATKDTVAKLFDEIKPIRLDVGLIKREIRKREKEIAQQT